MYYFQKNIADYRADTAHLSLLEHGAYNFLLDTYYLNEQPLPADERRLFRIALARTEEEQQAVRNVLEDFFTLSENGWVHNRCEEEIAAYQAKQNAQAENGRKGGRPKKLPENPSQTDKPLSESQIKPNENPSETQIKPNENPTETQKKPNQEPITNIYLQQQHQRARDDLPDEDFSDALPDGLPKTPMTPDWQPADPEAFAAQLRLAALPPIGSEAYGEGLVEFRSYWLSRTDAETPETWQHKFLQSLLHRKARQPAVANAPAVNTANAPTPPTASNGSATRNALAQLHAARQERAEGRSSGSLPPPLFDELAQGLQKLLALGLEGRPAADTLPAVLATWEQALGDRWVADMDKGRIAAGFQTLTETVSRFPAPQQLLQVIPPRLLPRALAKPPESEAEREARLAKNAAVRAQALSHIRRPV